MKRERWKDIPGWEGKYMVSNKGRILNVHKRKIKKIKCFRYCDAHLYRDGVCHHMLVHRAVLLAFKGFPPEGKPLALHLNHKRDDNRMENLKWGSQEENMQMDWRDGRRTPYAHWTGKFNESHPNSKPVLQYDLNGNLIKEWPNSREVERQLSLKSRSVRSCCEGRQKQYSGFVWKFQQNNKAA